MKRVITALITLVLFLSITGCSADKTEEIEELKNICIDSSENTLDILNKYIAGDMDFYTARDEIEKEKEKVDASYTKDLQNLCNELEKTDFSSDACEILRDCEMVQGDIGMIAAMMLVKDKDIVSETAFYAQCIRDFLEKYE